MQLSFPIRRLTAHGSDSASTLGETDSDSSGEEAYVSHMPPPSPLPVPSAASAPNVAGDDIEEDVYGDNWDDDGPNIEVDEPKRRRK